MFYDTFLKLCNQTGKTPTTIGREIGINKTTISFWKNGRSEPSDRTIMKIADYFHVDFKELREGNIVPISPLHQQAQKPPFQSIEFHNINNEQFIRVLSYAVKLSQLSEQNQQSIESLIDSLSEKGSD